MIDVALVESDESAEFDVGQVGLDSEATDVARRRVPQIRELLSIPEEMLIAGHISVGHRADAWPRQLSRKPVSEFAYGDRYGTPW